MITKASYADDDHVKVKVKTVDCIDLLHCHMQRAAKHSTAVGLASYDVNGMPNAHPVIAHYTSRRHGIRELLCASDPIRSDITVNQRNLFPATATAATFMKTSLRKKNNQP